MKLKHILKWFAGAVCALVALAALALFIAYWRSSNDCGRNTATQEATR